MDLGIPKIIFQSLRLHRQTSPLLILTTSVAAYESENPSHKKQERKSRVKKGKIVEEGYTPYAKEGQMC